MVSLPELLIVGGGPAGVSAALWARSRDLHAMLVDDRDSIGGTLHHIHFALRDVTGVRGVVGEKLAASYTQQLADAAVPVRLGVRAARIEGAGGLVGAGASDRDMIPRVTVVSESGERLEAHAVLIATGTRRRRLGVPGEREFEDRGVSYSANRDREQLRGRSVAVAGGGDAAYENALILAGLGCEVTLIVRGMPRTRVDFRERVEATPGIRVMTHARVTAIEGAGCVQTLVLCGPEGITQLPVDAIVIKVGEVPNSEWLEGAVERDAAGFVFVDSRQRTSLARVWAAGDIVRPALPSIAVAAGGAALAVADVRAELKGAGA